VSYGSVATISIPGSDRLNVREREFDHGLQHTKVRSGSGTDAIY
jgi:hypothetical protein